MLRVVTWNVNGIRSCQNSQSVKELLDSLDADIICLQETKITRDQLDESIALVEGYTSYFSFSRKRAGYSGVATYCRDSVRPFKAEEGLTGYFVPQQEIGCRQNVTQEYTDNVLKDIDAEGRCVITTHHIKKDEQEISVAVINVYCPRADWDNPARVDFKLTFYSILQLRCHELLESGYEVVIVGDVNTCHKPIDHCEPDDVENFGKRPDRQWLDQFLYNGENEGKFLDAFRVLHPNREKSFTCWDTLLNARANNYGTRIDYIFVSRKLGEGLRECEILSNIYGSDHCPVKAVFEVKTEASQKCPPFCTKFYKEFAGKQQKLSQFVMKRKIEELVAVQTTNNGEKKKAKLLTKSKQQNLLSYFAKPKSSAAEQSSGNQEGSETQLFVQKDELSFTEFGAEPSSSQQGKQQDQWRSLFKGPPAAPKCHGHGEPCVLRTVKKKGPNMNRQFWVCARAAGHSTDPQAKCNHFAWFRS